MKIFITYLTIISLLAGCATNTKSTALGGAIGAGTGAVLGGIADPGKNGEYRTRNVIVGSALGGMAGMITGSILHENTEKKKQEAFIAGKKSVEGAAGMPPLQNPKVEARWIDSKVVGNRYIEGHYEYVIVEPTRWEAQE